MAQQPLISVRAPQSQTRISSNRGSNKQRISRAASSRGGSAKCRMAQVVSLPGWAARLGSTLIR